MIKSFLDLVRDHYNSADEFIPLHAPVFRGNEIHYVTETIKSTFVSSVGAYVDQFEVMMKSITGAKYAIATVNGTAALHIALHSIGVSSGDEVITQALSFVATANAIRYTGADPVFLDVDLDSMSLSPVALLAFLESECEFKNQIVTNKRTGKRIKAIVPMHTFGNPGRIEEICKVANQFRLDVVEDSAESLGSYVNGKHTGSFGRLGVFSFNGNKTVTCGGGGAVVTDDDNLGKRLKHITTTAKVPHPWEYSHDELGFNYRMPNLNAALACAQLEQLDDFLKEKRELSIKYIQFFENTKVTFKKEIKNSVSNYWLNTIEFPSKSDRDKFLAETNGAKVMTRPSWNPLNTLPMYQNCFSDSLKNTNHIADRLVNIPSGVKWKESY
ncbi:LegC family aminotransferase [Leptospira sp. 85282-16]|uniref:LegC family aminotransferase n=1 Tax=Leptospira montravelensis TaxID=2484961 RepID=A0ABY2LT73_9LEPT|nr:MULTISPECIES: LegC family aminotransferase [Leptospira]MCT8332182.1 LegC family aminotransferase [Leptospira sp. 85282-16]TGK83417.1 LegC family aminotransferase [Leptospira montravelensis]TGL05419.1 LegC family aminotransferase [Leptospira montravelensis]